MTLSLITYLDIPIIMGCWILAQPTHTAWHLKGPWHYMKVCGKPHTPPSLPLGKMLSVNWTGGWMGQRFGLEALKKWKISWPCQEPNLNYSFIYPGHILPTTPTALSQLPSYSQSYPEYMCYSFNRLSVQQPLLIYEEMNMEVIWKWITVKWRQWLSWF